MEAPGCADQMWPQRLLAEVHGRAATAEMPAVIGTVRCTDVGTDTEFVPYIVEAAACALSCALLIPCPLAC